jgi:hypothetical protein
LFQWRGDCPVLLSIIDSIIVDVILTGMGAVDAIGVH